MRRYPLEAISRTASRVASSSSIMTVEIFSDTWLPMHTTGMPRESTKRSNSGPLLMGLSRIPSMRRSVKSRMRCISASLLCPCRAILSE